MSEARAANPTPPTPAFPDDAEASLQSVGAAARFVLRGETPAARLAGEALGVAAPGRINRAEAAGLRAMLRLGPDEWLLVADGEAPAGLAGSLAQALDGTPHSLVDVSARQVGFVLDGRLAARLISAGCPLDLRDGAFPVGAATRTIFLKAEIVLWRRAAQTWRLEVWRSFAPYLIGHLAEARRGAADL
ncbi:MAG: sarcosine oxidase subunit gamma [Methylobacteriaceae bacterium]|nr:sarcosine oxidase subunit gamma [Methylobacteriaceae bacterium]